MTKVDPQYQKAFDNAPTAIKHRIVEFSALSKEVKDNTPLLYFVLGFGQGTPPFKMVKQTAKYENPSNVRGQACSNCRFAYMRVKDKIFICSQIRGQIKPNAWCKLHMS